MWRRCGELGRLAPALAIGLLVWAPAGVAQAGFDGHRIGLEEYESNCPPCGPDASGVYFDLGIQTVGPGPEPYTGFGTWDVSDTNIRLENNHTAPFPYTVGLPSLSFYGNVFTDVDLTVPKIIGVSLESTNVAGLTDAILAFDADRVYLNFKGFDIPVGGYVSVDVQFVPEPGTLWLLGPGLLAAAGLRRRRPSGAR